MNHLIDGDTGSDCRSPFHKECPKCKNEEETIKSNIMDKSDLEHHLSMVKELKNSGDNLIRLSKHAAEAYDYSIAASFYDEYDPKNVDSDAFLFFYETEVKPTMEGSLVEAATYVLRLANEIGAKPEKLYKFYNLEFMRLKAANEESYQPTPFYRSLLWEISNFNHTFWRTECLGNILAKIEYLLDREEHSLEEMLNLYSKYLDENVVPAN